MLLELLEKADELVLVALGCSVLGQGYMLWVWVLAGNVHV